MKPPRCTVDFELSYDEAGDADAFDVVALPQDVLELFRKLNLPEPQPFPLMRIVHQIAQKLHGATDRDYVRPQDVIDLQLMMKWENVDMSDVKPVCKRLFANRKKQDWPPTLEVGQEWRDSYAALALPLTVLSSPDEAVEWTNALIRQIDAR